MEERRIAFCHFLAAHRSEARHLLSECLSVRPSVCHTRGSHTWFKISKQLYTVGWRDVSGFLRPHLAFLDLRLQPEVMRGVC